MTMKKLRLRLNLRSDLTVNVIKTSLSNDNMINVIETEEFNFNEPLLVKIVELLDVKGKRYAVRKFSKKYGMWLNEKIINSITWQLDIVGE